MADMNYEYVMEILKDECTKESTCAEVAKKVWKKTLNPIKRIRCKKVYEMFKNHSIGIKWAISSIERQKVKLEKGS